MRCRSVGWIVLASAVICCGGASGADPSSDPPKDKESSTPILDRLDNLGKKIFGGLRSGDRDKPPSSRPPTKASAADEPTPNRPSDRMYSPRAGSASGTASRRETGPSSSRRDSESSPSRRDSDPFALRREIEQPDSRGGLEPVAPRRDSQRESPRAVVERLDAEVPAPRTEKRDIVEKAEAPARVEKKQSSEAALPSEKPVPAVAGMAPIHERLESFRQSLFDKQGENAERAAEAKPAAETSDKPGQAASEPAVRENAVSQDSRSEALPMPVDRPAQGRAAVTAIPRTEKQSDAAGGKAPDNSAPQVIVAPTENAGVAEANNPADVAEGLKAPVRASEPKPPTPPKAAGFSTESVALSVETTGPRKIVVGKEGAYEVTVRNHSSVTADRVVVTLDLPSWTEIAGNEASVGTIVSGQGTAPSGQIRWLIPRLNGNRAEKLSLRIVPRQGRPFEMKAKVDYTPPAAQASIEVQEAKLAVALLGPREVFFGKAEQYKLEVTNTGTADAENVIVGFTSSSPGEKQATATQRIGVLPPGQKKAINVELTARQDGTLAIAVDARADGGARATLAQQVLVRRAKLKVAVEGPKVVYSGNEATYRIRVVNEGNAPANNVTVQAVLPRGAKYVSSLQGGRPAPEGDKVLWTVERLNVAADAALAMTCVLSAEGSGQLDVQCAAEADTRAMASVVTKIETAPNLVLAVEEPSGPVGLDGEAVYQVRLQNRGTAAADAVEVVVYFAKNVEPVSAEGTRHKIASGQVVFDSLPTLAPGQATTFQVKAKADKAGNHVYRVEVYANATGIRLVREGTTRFYAPNSAGDPTSLAQPESRDPVGSDRESRTADRRDRATPPGDFRGPGGSIKK